MNNRPGISQATREQVLKAAREMGYDRRVGLRTSRYIGFVYPPNSFGGNLGIYHAALFGGILESLSHHRYDFALVDLVSDKKKNESYSQFFARKELRGVLMQARPEDLHMVEEITDEGFPIVLVASHWSNAKHPVNWVACNSKEPTRQAMEYLIGLGHERIAFVTGNWHATDLDERFSGFSEALQAAGLKLDPSMVLRVPADVTAGMSAMRRLRSLLNPPTAVMFTTQFVTMGGLRACQEMGVRVPEDVSIIGFDDHDTRFMAAPVYSAICQDTSRLGYDAAQALIQILGGAQQPIQNDHQAVFEVHETTGAPAPRKHS